MRHTAAVAAAGVGAAVLVWLAGCANPSRPSARQTTGARPTVLDVLPSPAAPKSTVTVYPPAATPVNDAAARAGGESASTATYIVRKGDTLFGIAKAHYGSGSQWQKIASANPGVTPQSLRVGQTLRVP